MEEDMMQSPITTMDKASHVALDIESLINPPDKCCDKCCAGGPKVTKALSRKGSLRMDRRNGEEQEGVESSRKLLVKVVQSQLNQSKQPLPNKALIAVQSPATNSPLSPDSGDGRSKRLKSLVSINPRKILLLFATVSSMGTMILIYFTLAINRRGGN